MQRVFVLVFMLLIFSSHDMFLKMETYHLKPNSLSKIMLYNGTFEMSENVISRDRMIDVSIVGNGNRILIDSTAWTEYDETTILNFTTGNEGTWIAGVCTKARNIEMDAEAFNDYLDHDGVLDMLSWRKENDELGSDAIEKYSKHVKVVFQVGDKKTDDWTKELGYPIEFIPISNPYDAQVGDNLQMKLLWHGEPLADQLVYAGNAAHDHDAIHAHDHDHDVEGEHHHHDATQLHTDANGIVTMKISEAGHWYLRTINMDLSNDAGLTHESNWATITFEAKGGGEQVAHGHTHANGTHHTHDHGPGLNKYLYVLGGILFIAGLVLLLKRRK